mmetsp:Transcript_6977/g.12872  ORF Transcript_6977/g.12872 Transcript_6977/m.12872 type:complete len:176 (-) Transcript_6977:181-708(-)|eukprot:CAMPEP_0197519060 /NCGR_PEP_ID=MMETSP1318-20131121/4307_1 /TAXON_ID=552666 /ORGANISM="Partenskyella glossopodia, Strain RCC365" /LENGTH=175 /DNA_ID=CAMNT_0043069817 /DNA_START=162 /DNA_END=689 /DNA_ORIENTATION=-
MESKEPKEERKKVKRGISFAEDVEFTPKSVKIEEKSGILEAHLGFALPFMEYEVRVSLADIRKHFPDTQSVEISTSRCVYVKCHNQNHSVELSDEGGLLYLHLHTLVEGVDVDENVIVSDGNGKSVSLKVTATIFHKNRGTPMLKDGIRCISKHTELETDAETDFEGFGSVEDDP